MRSKLDTTSSFIDLYLHACGDSEVPLAYQLWACISLVAASVEDRVWYEKFRDDKLPPNLYIGLLGPSANGKGEAIKRAMKIAALHPRLHVYNGRATPQFLFQYMSKSRLAEDGQHYPNNKVLLVQEELGDSIDRGDSADHFVKFMTANYAKQPFLKNDGTITRDLKTVRDPIFNWLFGSNLEWMLDVFPATSISGGTWGRIVGVNQGYIDKRVRQPTTPYDYDYVMDHLHERLEELLTIEGRFTLTQHADIIDDKWYTERETPTDYALRPAWKRQHDLVLKLAMVLSLSDSLDLRITGNHMSKAQILSEMVMRKLGEIQAAAVTTPETKGISFAKQTLKGVKRPMLHTELLRKFYAKGLGGRDQLSHAIQTLEESGEITHRDGGRSRMYMWVGKKRMLRNTQSGAEDARSE